MALSLDDFFGFNQSQDDEKFTILDKKHLMELKPALYEKKPKVGEVFIHQELSSRIIADYDRLLLHHQAGTGKTRVIIHSREYFRSFMEEQDMPLEMRRFNINKAYILTPSRTLINEFRKEIINHMGSFYEEHIIAKRSTAKDEGALIKAINKYYEIMTHGEFVKLIENKNPSDLDDFMSNCVVYVDEAHKTSTIEDRGEGGKNVMVSTSTYVQLHKAFHAGSYNKIILLTATPMINLPKDIILLMNLILPYERQMKESEFNWDDVDSYPEQFGSYFRGYVSYILRGKTGAIKTNVGTYLYNPSIQNNKSTGGENISVAPSRDGKELGSTIIEYSIASPYQNNVYQRSGLTGSLKSFGTAQMQMSNFVFPEIDGRSWFGDGDLFKEAPRIFLAYEQEQSFLNPDQKARKFNTPEIKAEYNEIMKKALTTDLPLYSTKLARVRDIVKDKYVNRDLEDPDFLVPDNKGICFIYSHLVKYGVEMAALMLKNNGYTEFNEKHSVFKTKPFANKDRVMDIQKTPRYFLMTGSTSPSVVSSALELLNSYENRFGEYIQVFIGSEVASHGLSINHAIAMLFLTPLWNHTNEEQSQDRVFRSVSHDTRLKYKADNDMPSPDSIQVEVYKLATVFQTGNDNYESVDFYLYQLSTIKDDSIKPMVDTIRKFSIDCVNNSERNQANDCNSSSAVVGSDYSEKLKWYLSKEVLLLTKILEEQLFIRDYITVRELEERSKIDNKVLHLALLNIINMKLKFNNRLGVRMILNHSNGIFFLNNNLYMKGNSADLDYTKWFLGTKNYEGYNLLQDYIDFLAEERSTSVFEDIKLVKSVDELKKILPNDYKTRIGIFEKSFESIMKGQPTLGEQLIYDKYKNQVYRASEPIKEINDVIALQDRPAKGRKAGIGKGGKTKIEDRSLHTQVRAKRRLTDKDRDVIYLHMMIPIDVAPKVALADFNKAEGYIRVFKTKEGRWRQCNQTEYEVYQNMIAMYRTNIFRTLDVNLSSVGVYGLKINDLIVIKTFNNQMWNNGKQCNNYKSSEKEIIISRIYNYLIAINRARAAPGNVTNCKDLIDYLQYAGLLFTDKLNNEMAELSQPESYIFVEEEVKEEISAAEDVSSSLVGYKEDDYAGFGNFM